MATKFNPAFQKKSHKGLRANVEVISPYCDWCFSWNSHWNRSCHQQTKGRLTYQLAKTSQARLTLCSGVYAMFRS